MKALGYKRIDKQGRFIIPREYLKQYKVKSGDGFEYVLNRTTQLLFREYKLTDVFFATKI